MEDELFEILTYNGDDILFDKRVKARITRQDDDTFRLRRRWPLEDMHTVRLPAALREQLIQDAQASDSVMASYTQVFHQWGSLLAFCRLMGFTEVNDLDEWGQYYEWNEGEHDAAIWTTPQSYPV